MAFKLIVGLDSLFTNPHIFIGIEFQMLVPLPEKDLFNIFNEDCRI